jgi:hypothetical protein
MYELNRILLQSIGPKGARYEDVVLDFRDENGDPARGSVMFLENGGGKSVLLKLGFSVVLPGRKFVVGAGANTKTLENFVLTGDTGHVVLEWRRIAPDGKALPELLLTGKVYEWRGRQHSADSNNLREAWYTLRPVESGLTLDTLPTRAARDGATHKRTFASFKEQVEEANRLRPELELTWTDVQRKWTEHLDALGLDPELFKYQGEMNADEGDADELLAFRSHDAFVNFLLGAVTDREGPTELATNVDLYAEKLRDRERLQLEQRFVEGALASLRPLAEAAERQELAGRDLRDAQRRAEEAHGQFAVAAQEATAEQDRLEELAEEQETSARTLNTRGRELEEQLRELRRRRDQFRLDIAEAAWVEADDRRNEAKRELDAWRATEPLANRRAAAAKVKSLATQLSEAEREAAPLLDQHAAAARRLAGALLHRIDEARRQAERAEEDAGNARERVKRERAAEGIERTQAGKLRAEATTAEQDLAAIDTERERLVGSKLLARGQSAAAALETLATRQTDAERREESATERIAAIDEYLADLTNAAASAMMEEERANEASGGLDAEHATLRARADELEADARLRELAAVDRLDVWRMSTAVHQVLTEAIAHGERGIVLLELEAADDRRAAQALEETGRLPAHRDAEATVEALRRADVPAVSGWDYLAESVRAEERERLLRRVPALVGGVVLTNPAHRERAEAILEAASLSPTTVVALGDSGELAAAGADELHERFVVPPTAALYDEEAGDDERELRRDRLAGVTERRRELEERLRADHALRQRLEGFLVDCPFGRLDELENAAKAQRKLANEAAGKRRAANEESRLLREERPQCDKAAIAARIDLRAIERARPQLEAFHQREARERELRETVRIRTAEANGADDAAERHARLAEQNTGQAEGAVRRVDEERRRADRLTEELQRVEGAGESIERVVAAPIEELRSNYELAGRLLREATTGSALAAEHRQAEEAEAEANAALEEYTNEERARAEELLAQASDRAARREGERRAGRELEATEAARADARADREALERELDRFAPKDESGRGPRAQLTGELVPEDLDQALALIKRLDGELAQAREDQRAAGEAAREARARATQAASRAEVLTVTASSVATVLGGTRSGFEPQGPPSGTFSGSSAEAQALLKEVTTDLQRADESLRRAEEEARGLAERLSRYAMAAEFEAMSGNLRERLGRSDAEQLVRDAEGLVRPLEERLQEIAKELASIEHHRSLLLERLLALVQTGLNSLRQAGRSSRLPGELGDWSGKQFLRIDFDVPDSEDVLLERLGEVLDATVAGEGDRDGMTMVLRGVRAAAEPRGFRVTVLKPDTVLRDERVPVTAMGEFSGGQRLTAAIALYCTLAAMRSESRGRQKVRAGVLFLDNPIGKANAEYLLDIQLKVAERVGVQLIYTTGVYDTNALSKFPCVLRLRNDLDMRAGMQHIRVAEPLRRALVNGHDDDDDAGHLAVARVLHERDETPSRT